MTICERMFKIMNEKGIKAINLAEKLGINKSVISTWKKRGNNPPSEYLIQICELLEVDIYTLLGTDKKKISKEEQELLEYFRKCNPGNKQVILNAAKSMQQAELEPDQEEQKLFDSKIG